MDNNTAMVINLVIMFLMGFMVWMIVLRNFLINWIKVKNPMSKYNVLVEVEHPVQNYFACGQIEKNFLYYKGKKTRDNPKAQRIVDLTEVIKTVGLQNCVERKFGVQNIKVDDAKSCIFYKDGDQYKAVSGYSAEAIDDLVTDAQNRPSEDDGLMKPRIFQFVMIGAVCLMLVGLYFIYSNDKANVALIDGHLKMTYDYTRAIANNLNVTVVPINFTGIGG